MGVEMEQKAKTKNTAQHRFAGKIGWLIGGVVLGIVVFGVSMFMVMPKMMLTVHQSRYDTVEKTCEELTKAISAEGWNSPRVPVARRTSCPGVGFTDDRRLSGFGSTPGVQRTWHLSPLP